MPPAAPCALCRHSIPFGVDLAKLRRDLESVVGDRRVTMQPSVRAVYARDMWARGLLERDQGIVGPQPDAVVWPEHQREIVSLVRVAREHGIPLIPYGGGSGVCGGVVPTRGGIAVDLKRMRELRSISHEDLLCDVQAGMNGERFERQLASRGYTLGHFPSSIYCSTVGGWVATRAAGQLSTKYGKIEDRVMGLTMVTGRGEVISTDGPVRALRGPNWTQLLCGSEGTLGIITSARFRIAPAPQIKLYRAYEFASVTDGLAAIRAVLQRDLRPAVVRLYDPMDALVGHGERQPRTVVGAAVPRWDASGTSAKPGWNQALQHVALRHAGLTNRVAGLVARHTHVGARLIIGFEGARIRTEAEANAAAAELAAAGAMDLGEEPGFDWLRHRYSVSYKMSKIFRDGSFVDTMEVATTWERLGGLYDAVRQAIGQHALVMAHFSHAYADGCSIYFTFVARTRPADRLSLYDTIWRDGLSAASRMGATISHHHGIGLLKAPFMEAEHRGGLQVLRALKHVFDPEGVMNPDKLGLVPMGASWRP